MKVEKLHGVALKQHMCTVTQYTQYSNTYGNISLLIQTSTDFETASPTHLHTLTTQQVIFQ